MKNLVPKIAVRPVLVVTVFATVSLIGFRSIDYLSVNVDRAFAFGVLFIAGFLTHPRYWKLTVIAAMCGPGAIELLQLCSSVHLAHVDDIIVQMAGALLGITVSAIVHKFFVRVNVYRRNSARRLALKRFNSCASIKQMPVKSRMIEAIYFSPADGQLRIRLNNGHERLFEGVAEKEAIAIVTAPSPGNYYITEFKNRHRRTA